MDFPIQFPCGQCIGCKLEYSRQWAVRCMHEAESHLDNSYITLTYADEHLPPGGTLVKKHYQTFMKRLRKNTGAKIKFFQCGEYGEQLKRPHYHSILFGIDFEDKVPWKQNDQGDTLYTSDFLTKTWGLGHCSVGAVTFESCAYVARYVTKKITGQLAETTLHYFNIDYDTGECVARIPEYITMSRGGRTGKGIAHDWYTKYGGETFRSDSVVINGREQSPPDYYARQLKSENPDLHARLKRARLRRAQAHASDTTPRRLRDRETVRQAAVSHLNRTYEAEQ